MVGHIHNLKKKDYMALIPNYNLEKKDDLILLPSYKIEKTKLH